MSNTSQPTGLPFLNFNVEKKSSKNPADSTSIAMAGSASPTTALNKINIDDTGSAKQGERTTRKECYRLGRRKLLFEQRRKASDYALFFAMIGLAFMVLEQELTMSKVYDKVKKKGTPT
jgi:potassium intermediate/small conductance calcium-activated channel subfamily N